MQFLVHKLCVSLSGPMQNMSMIRSQILVIMRYVIKGLHCSFFLNGHVQLHISVGVFLFSQGPKLGPIPNGI